MSEIDDTRWDAFAHSHPDGAFFHLSGWKRIVREVFGHRAHSLAVIDGDRLRAILPLVEIRSRLFGHALISNAFCVGGGPLAVDTASLAEVLTKAEHLGRRLGVDYIELRDTPVAGPGWISRSDLYVGFAKTMAQDEQENLKQIPKKQRAVVRKALDRGMTTAPDESPQAFFDLYARNMRDHGTPALPRRFFERLLQVFGPDCEILTTRRDGRPVSSVLSFYHRGRVLPYYTGCRPEVRAEGVNDLLYWTLMRRSLERGCAVFDFGRSKVDTGSYHYKCHWGFEPRPIVHQYRLLKLDALPNINPTNPKYAAFIQAWRRLPLPLANAASPFLSRSLG